MHPEPQLRCEPGDAYILPAALRRAVSRWGFDPVWNEASFPPLTIDTFSERLPGPAWERIQLTDAPADAPPGEVPLEPVELALHEVHYDGAKERWYADLRVELRRAVAKALPFVQLSLVTYQPDGLEGHRASPITLCDMYKLVGDRELEVRRRGRRRMSITLRGDFDQAPGKNPLPRREVVARVTLRAAGLPAEIELCAANDRPMAPPIGPGFVNEASSTRSAALAERAISVASNVLTQEVAVIQLVATADNTAYKAHLDLDDLWFEAPRGELGPRAVVLNVEEYEYYAAAEGSADQFGDGLVFIDKQPCGRRLVFNYQLEIGGRE